MTTAGQTTRAWSSGRNGHHEPHPPPIKAANSGGRSKSKNSLFPESETIKWVEMLIGQLSTPIVARLKSLSSSAFLPDIDVSITQPLMARHALVRSPFSCPRVLTIFLLEPLDEPIRSRICFLLSVLQCFLREAKFEFARLIPRFR